MATLLEELFSCHENKPVTSDSHKQLGSILQRCPSDEVERFLLGYHPEKLHLQILRALVARSVGCHKILLEGISSESKEVSRFCAQSGSLFSSVTNDIYDPKILLPLLQTVSHAIRKKIVTNLAKYMRNNNANRADLLFETIADVWGPETALPLLCRSSEGLIQKELKNDHLFSSSQLLTIAQRYPKLALDILENGRVDRNPLKAFQFVVRKNLPASLNYCFSNFYLRLLSNSAVKYVLRNYLEIIMAAPSQGSYALNVECVKKVLKPESFQLLILKQVEYELERNTTVQCGPDSFISHLPPLAVSSLMKDIAWASIENFWEVNESLLKLLEHSDRSRIASDLFKKTKDFKWVALMTCEMSIPLIKEELRSEANAYVRASLVEKLLETAAINKDKKALEEICEFVAVRYRNDREVLAEFFENLPDLVFVSNQTWTLLYSLANKFQDPTLSCYSQGINRLYSAALKRDGKSGLKVYVARFFKENVWTDASEDFTKLDPELYQECISLIFTDAKVSSVDPHIERCLKQLLPVIIKWNESFTKPLVFENVNKFVLKHLDCPMVIDFVLTKNNGFKADFILNCFEVTSNPKYLQNIVQKRPESLKVSRDAVEKMADDFIQNGFWKYIKLLMKLRRKGQSEILQYIFEKSLTALRDPNFDSPRYAILLLALTAPEIREYLKEMDHLLSETDIDDGLPAPYLPHPQPTECENQENILEQSRKKDSVYRGIGNSFSHIDKPSLIIDKLLKFCISGDLMLFVRDSVYSVCFSLPFAKAKQMLELLVNKPVSVMKHALRIHRIVTDVGTQRDFLLALVDSEKHITSQTVLFEYALSSLQNTKKQEIWVVVKEMILRLKPDDKSLVTVLLVRNVPLTFWEEYVKLLLDKTESLKDTTIELVSQVLTKIFDKVISMPISNEFHEKLIKEYFLSDRYFLELCFHQVVSYLFIEYLKKTKTEDLAADIEHKKLFLLERLNTAATKTAIIAYNAEACCHSTRALLNQFVELFCSTCRHQVQSGITKDVNNISIFLDTVLGFIIGIDENLLFSPFVSLSLTAIATRERGETSKSTGQLLGQFIDSVYAKNRGLAQYVLPDLLKSHVNSNEDVLLDILHPPEQCNPDILLLRQIIVAKILPTNWKREKSLASFREKYMTLVRNSPSEALLFTD